jgi:hypothetical protein
VLAWLVDRGRPERNPELGISGPARMGRPAPTERDAVAVFFLVSNYYYIPFEEHLLARKFGGQFEAYASKTGRWI